MRTRDTGTPTRIADIIEYITAVGITIVRTITGHIMLHIMVGITMVIAITMAVIITGDHIMDTVRTMGTHHIIVTRTHIDNCGPGGLFIFIINIKEIS